MISDLRYGGGVSRTWASVTVRIPGECGGYRLRWSERNDEVKFDRRGELVGPLGNLTSSNGSRWRAQLTRGRSLFPQEGSEPAVCGTLLNNKREGVCVCALPPPLFASGGKFNSGTG
jgi:hypothetical protein